MAFNKQSLLALALIAIYGQLALADVYDDCIWLDTKLTTELKDPTDRDAGYKLGMKYTSLKENFPFKSLPKLAKAWNNLRNDKACSAKGDEDVCYIDRCNAIAWKTLKHSLGADAQDYVAWCNKQELWSAKLDSALEKTSKSAREAVMKVLSDQFISEYNVEYPNSRQLHFGAVIGANCCQPETVPKASLNSLIRVYESMNGVGKGREFFTAHPDSVEEYFKKYWKAPCKRFADDMDQFMNTFSCAVAVSGQGDDFISAQTQAFQDIVFRYKVCSNIQSDTSTSRVVKSIVHELINA